MIMLCSLEQIDHVHSIVIDMELEFCPFNPGALAFFWGGTGVEKQKEKIMSMEWQEQNGEDLEPHVLFNQLNLLFQTLSIAQCSQTYAPQQLQVPRALLDRRNPDTSSNSQVQGVIPSTVTSKPLTPLSTTRMSLPASTVNTTKGKAQISKRKNDVPTT